MMGALPFVPIDDVDRARRFLKSTIPSDHDTFESIWIGTSATDLLFDQWTWNQYEACQTGIPHSSNIAKGWYNGFSSLIGCAHPTVWKFLDALWLEQALTDIKITSHLTRNLLEPRSQKWVKHDQRLNTVIEKYDHYDDVLDYLKVLDV